MLKTDVKKSQPQIQRSVHCPGCGFDLHGRFGEHLDCYECGASCDVRTIAAEQYFGRASIAMPTQLALLLPAFTLLVGYFLVVASLRNMILPWQMALAVSFLMLLFSHRPAWREYGGWRGLRIALVPELIAASWIGGMIIMGMAWQLVGKAQSPTLGLSVPILIIASLVVLTLTHEQVEHWLNKHRRQRRQEILRQRHDLGQVAFEAEDADLFDPSI